MNIFRKKPAITAAPPVRAQTRYEPAKRLLDPKEPMAYTPSCATDIRATFARATNNVKE
jgi:hypothetical protein